VSDDEYTDEEPTDDPLSSGGGSDPAGGADPGASDLGEEARRLAEAVQQWARRTVPAPPSGHAGPECQWCPLCQLASVLRGEHPELVERVTEAGTALASAFKALMESAAQQTPAQHPARHPGSGDDPARPGPAPHPGAASNGDSPRVQRIRLTDPIDRPSDQPPEEA
jgi:hypothetical protein